MFTVSRKIVTTLASVVAAAAAGTGVAFAVAGGGEPSQDVVTLVGSDESQPVETATEPAPAVTDPASPAPVKTSEPVVVDPAPAQEPVKSEPKSEAPAKIETKPQPKQEEPVKSEPKTETKPVPAPDDPIRQTAPPPDFGSESHILPGDSPQP